MQLAPGMVSPVCSSVTRPVNVCDVALTLHSMTQMTNSSLFIFIFSILKSPLELARFYKAERLKEISKLLHIDSCLQCM